MSAFTVELENQPGELARLCEAMANGGINLLLCATTRAGSGVVALIADDEAFAQTVLDNAGIDYLMHRALTVRMENKPGIAAATFRKLADAGVNVNLVLPVHISDELFFAVICVDNEDAARGALGDQIVKE